MLRAKKHVGCDVHIQHDDCGSHTGNLALAMTSGWRERRNAKGAWFCPQCVQRNAEKRRGSKNVPKKAASADRDLDAA